MIFFEKPSLFKHRFYPKGECKSLRRCDRKTAVQSHAQKLDFKKSGNGSILEQKML
nr:MAG TPA: hypothetical protein [Caudoviricetes sp.]